MKVQIDLPPDKPDRQDAIIRYIVECWSELRIADDPGAATWEELERIEREVTDCLSRHDVATASSLTAYAMLLVNGSSDF